MKEQIVSFEIAKLAKERGFAPDNPSVHSVPMYYDNKNLSDGQEEDWDIGDRYIAPTQALLQKWLRETHNICVTISGALNVSGYYYSVRHNYISSIDGDVKYDSYEKALETGLQKALKLIK